MNETITHDGKEYEVLPLDRISEITHAKLAGGAVVEANWRTPLVEIDSPANYALTRFGIEEIEPFGIHPIKLIEKKPVEFAGRCFAGSVHPTSQHIMLEVPLDAVVEIGNTYQLVEIVGGGE